MVFRRVQDVTEGALWLNAPRRAVLVQSPVIKEMGPLIVVINLVGGVELIGVVIVNLSLYDMISTCVERIHM